MKALAFLASALILAGLAGCGGSSGKPARPKKQGSHVRVVNATDGALSFILYPKQLNDQNAPGEANFFQKEPPGPRRLQILSTDKKLLQEVPVTLASGTPTTYIVRGGPKAFQVSEILNEERFAPEGRCRVTLSSGYDGPAVRVELRGPGGPYDLGQAARIERGGSKVLSPGGYEVWIEGKKVAQKELVKDVAYSVVVRPFKGGPAASILRNSPPDLIVVGVERAASAG